MIKAYFVGIPTEYEGEDIEIRYSIFENEELIAKKTILQDYVKPAIVNQAALITLLKELKQYDNSKEITVIMNDPSLDELLRGVSQTKNKDVLKMLRFTQEKITKLNKPVTIKDISRDREELEKWNEELKI